MKPQKVQDLMVVELRIICYSLYCLNTYLCFFRLGGIDFEAANIIISAMTGGDVLVNGENAQSILQASTFLQCPLAEMAAADYMMSNITLSNAFSVFFLALNFFSLCAHLQITA